MQHDPRFEATLKVDDHLVEKVLHQPTLFSTQILVRVLRHLAKLGDSDQIGQCKAFLGKELDKRIAEAQPRLRSRSYGAKGPPRIRLPGTDVEVWNPRRPIPRPDQNWWYATARQMHDMAGGRPDGTRIGIDVRLLRVWADAIRLMLPPEAGGLANPRLPHKEHLLLPPGYGYDSRGPSDRDFG